MGIIAEKLKGARARWRIERVDLGPELAGLVDGESIWVRQMSTTERGVYEMARVQFGPKGQATVDMKADRERLLVRCICDESGKREFADDDVALVGSLPSELTDAIFEAARRVNGMEVKESQDPLSIQSPGSPSG